MTAASITLISVLIGTMQAQTPGTAAPLGSFADYVKREWPGERAQQDVNCRALDLMADAIDAVRLKRSATDNSVRERLDRFRQLSRSYCTGAPADRQQPERLRRAFVQGNAAVETLAKSIDARSRLSADLNALERAATSIDEDAPLRRQPDVIERFFHHGADLLTMLDR